MYGLRKKYSPYFFTSGDTHELYMDFEHHQEHGNILSRATFNQVGFITLDSEGSMSMYVHTTLKVFIIACVDDMLMCGETQHIGQVLT